MNLGGLCVGARDLFEKGDVDKMFESCKASTMVDTSKDKHEQMNVLELLLKPEAVRVLCSGPI